jgi:hypothetical protein
LEIIKRKLLGPGAEFAAKEKVIESIEEKIFSPVKKKPFLTSVTRGAGGPEGLKTIRLESMPCSRSFL